MTGINLLFLSAFLFLCNIAFRKFTRKATKYAVVCCLMIFVNLPIFFVLWDYYSLINLFYSLFGGISVFCALLILRFVARCILRDFGESLQNSAKIRAFYAINPRVFVVIFTFSAVLFLGHLDLIAFDIFSASREKIALFIGVFIFALYFADRFVGIFALIAFIIALIFMRDSAQSVIFALFDGYLLIYSFVCSVVWGVKQSIKYFHAT